MVASHLQGPPDPSLWKNELFFESFDGIVAKLLDPDELERAWAAMCEDSTVQGVAAAIATRFEDTADLRRNLLLASRFCEHKRGGAIELVGEVVLGRAELAQYRTPSGTIRRRPLALLLFERDPRNLLAIELWHRWHSHRTGFYRTTRLLDPILLLSEQPWSAAIMAALETLRGAPFGDAAEFEAHRVLQGPDGDVLLALQEWPKQRSVRVESGDVVSGQVPDWTLLHVLHGGNRLDVTDSRPERGVAVANAILGHLVTDAPRYELLLEPMSDRKLNEFLTRLTSRNDRVFPLIEIVAEETWNPHRAMLTLTGTPSHTVESSIETIRKIGAFALDWRTVRSAKVAFENHYRITVFFPEGGDAKAISFSDVDRDKRVTARFAELLKGELGADVGPKARRACRRPELRRGPTPRKHSAEWWEMVLAPLTDRPPGWLSIAHDELEKQGLLSTSRYRVLQCGSPYLDRKAVGVDSIDCDGEVELPWNISDPDDPTASEDEGLFRCSRGDHVWRPTRYGVPVDERVRVQLQHSAVWEHLLHDLAHYGEVEEEPGRPGVASLRLIDARVALVYVPMVQDERDLEPDSGGRTRTVWVIPPRTPAPNNEQSTITLTEVLTNADKLSAQWKVKLIRHRQPSMVTLAPPRGQETPNERDRPRARVIELRAKGVWMDGKQVFGAKHRGNHLMLLLHRAAAADDGKGAKRRSHAPRGLSSLISDKDFPDVEPNDFHTWVSRTRTAFDRAFPGEPKLGKRVIITASGKYRLGDGFTCHDQRSHDPEAD